jgi:homocysteine S-methyltransferase
MAQQPALPRTSGPQFLTDGGLETTLVFHDGLDLPCFAAFPLVESDEGRSHLRAYFDPYLATAGQRGMGFILDTPTWRANPDWAQKLGYGPAALAEVNRQASSFAKSIRDERLGSGPILINGVIGPRGDGYQVGATMTADEATNYHGEQIRVFRAEGLDMVTGVTMTYAAEAIGIVNAGRTHGMPVVISFTVETDGRLPSGQPLGEAIAQTERETGSYPLYYAINCAHPEHFEAVLAQREPWTQRLGGVRANASRKSHAELDAATELDPGDPAELGADYRRLITSHPTLKVLGGCCGTDHRHIAAICEACL